MLTKQETLLKGRLSGEQKGKGTWENCPTTWLSILGFIVMRLVSGFFLASHSDSGYSGGTCIAQSKWRALRRSLGSGRTRGVSFDLSQVLTVGGRLLLLCSLPGPPVIK